MNKQKVITKLEKYVDNKSTSLNHSRVDTNEKKLKYAKPKVKLSYGANFVKYTNEHLGPGCYNVSLDTVKKNQKNENFQFFNSS